MICDNTFVSESSEEADRLRDPSHVRNYGVAEWHSFFELAGLEVADEARHGARHSTSSRWLARTETPAPTPRACASCSATAFGRRSAAAADVVLKGAKS